MSVFGALQTGRGGLTSFATKFAALSDNISNADTVGYKRKDTQFQTLVNTASARGAYVSGSVSSNTRTEFDKQGSNIATGSTTDMAVNGDGYFVVSNAQDGSIDRPFYLSRAGSFVPDADGNLVNSAGYYLQGWKIPATGVLPVDPVRDGFSDLVDVNISEIEFANLGTTAIGFSGNLPSQLTNDGSYPPRQVQTSVEYYDDLGGPQRLNIRWTASSTVANTWTVEFRDGGSPDPTTSIYDLGSGYTGALGEVDQIDVTFDGIVYNVNTAAATSIQDVAAAVQAAIGDPDVVVTGFGSRLSFADTLAGSARVATVADVSAGTISPITGTSVAVADEGLLLGSVEYTFNNSGAFSGMPATIGNLQGGPNGLRIAQPNGANTGTFALQVSDNLQPITLTMGGNANEVGSLTQFEGDYTPTEIEKNGTQYGTVSRVEITDNGRLTAVFNNGVRRDIFIIPLARVNSEDGLKESVGNAWEVRPEAGQLYLYDPGIGATGDIVGNALEGSTVDLAEELTELITTQRAYNSAAKVIQTADEMLDTAERIKR